MTRLFVLILAALAAHLSYGQERLAIEVATPSGRPWDLLVTGRADLTYKRDTLEVAFPMSTLAAANDVSICSAVVLLMDEQRNVRYAASNTISLPHTLKVGQRAPLDPSLRFYLKLPDRLPDRLVLLLKINASAGVDACAGTYYPAWSSSSSAAALSTFIGAAKNNARAKNDEARAAVAKPQSYIVSEFSKCRRNRDYRTIANVAFPGNSMELRLEDGSLVSIDLRGAEVAPFNGYAVDGIEIRCGVTSCILRRDGEDSSRSGFAIYECGENEKANQSLANAFNDLIRRLPAAPRY